MELRTERLLLNSFRESDASLLAKLAGDKRVVEMMASIPYPYETSMAESWIRSHQKQREEGFNYIFAIRLKESRDLIGSINIRLNKRHNWGSLGYWVGYQYWGQGYGTEVLKKVIQFGFEEKRLNRVWAEYKTMNVASGRMMEKAGMKHEGIMRNHHKQSPNNYLDMSIKSILKSEYRGELC